MDESKAGKKASEILMERKNLLDVWKNDAGKVCVNYGDGEIKNGPFLVAAFGCGDTFEEACEDYLPRIIGKTIVFNAYSSNRREMIVIE